MKRYLKLAEWIRRLITVFCQMPLFAVIVLFVASNKFPPIWLLCVVLFISFVALSVYVISKTVEKENLPESKKDSFSLSEKVRLFTLKQPEKYFENIYKCAIGDRLTIKKENKRFFAYKDKLKIGVVPNRYARKKWLCDFYIYNFEFYSFPNDLKKGEIYKVVVRMDFSKARNKI